MSPSSMRKPLLFAHRGGRAHFRENTLEAFENALKYGLSAVETDAWLSRDGQVVLDHDGVIRSRWRRRRTAFGALDRIALPPHVLTMKELLAQIGDDVDVQIDIKGEGSVAEAVVETWRSTFPDSMDRLWLAHDGYTTSDWRMVAGWRSLDPSIHLIDSTALKRLDLPIRSYAERLGTAGIEVMNLRGKQWTAELVSEVHSAGLLAFGFGVHDISSMKTLLAMGIDAIYSDHVDRLLALEA